MKGVLLGNLGDIHEEFGLNHGRTSVHGYIHGFLLVTAFRKEKRGFLRVCNKNGSRDVISIIGHDR